MLQLKLPVFFLNFHTYRLVLLHGVEEMPWQYKRDIAESLRVTLFGQLTTDSNINLISRG